ncbi:hypothetical protein DIE04_14425 [Burkholderia sp. Bp8994]|nr:hypothetical protein DIE20_12660 [Burkholderia sp. Bp9131]RQR73057.1 hypothetical protein DIE12_15500 [Burkholderia sp. Bp9015]RQR83519.1 hypothetical protein DIE10_13320 [Burkholderia sp. Bp9011]RQR93267.1 hypothetical protein DIE09_14655 [Burkholderia sp. Bp9010]RQR96733.1 hypothetical protein DIE04_14425 [Burkholderia sp. Bp8994]RQS04781.1 hypothetical protein DIE02_18125 [Burkholderia sp. Bp8991]RQS31983.1 hypothetical protein DIE05_07785 [Burkholderia sp. Bp8995]RQS41888.1 hypothetic
MLREVSGAAPFVGAGGIDAASLGFGRQTKHPACRQSPLSPEQHCAGGMLACVSVRRQPPFSVRRIPCVDAARIGLALLVQARCAS